MSGILSKQKEAVLMEKLLEEIAPLKRISTRRYRLEMIKCRMEYEDVEFAKRIVKKLLYGIFEKGIEEESISFSNCNLTDADCTALPFLSHVLGTLNAEGESELNEGTSNYVAEWKLCGTL